MLLFSQFHLSIGPARIPSRVFKRTPRFLKNLFRPAQSLLKRLVQRFRGVQGLRRRIRPFFGLGESGFKAMNFHIYLRVENLPAIPQAMHNRVIPQQAKSTKTLEMFLFRHNWASNAICIDDMEGIIYKPTV